MQLYRLIQLLRNKKISDKGKKMMIIRDCNECHKDYMYDPNQQPQYTKKCQECIDKNNPQKKPYIECVLKDKITITNRIIGGDKKMAEQNIIKQDWKKIKKFFSSMREGFISLMVFLLRWMLSMILAGIMIKNIGQQSGWIIAIIVFGVYLAGFLFHKTYDFEKWLIKTK